MASFSGMVNMMLTAKQESFVTAYCSNGHNATQAGITAGYSAKTARQITSRLLTKANIKARIGEFMNSVNETALCTVESLINELEKARTTALNSDNPSCSAAVAATMAKAKLTGLDQPAGRESAEAQKLDISFIVKEPIKDMVITRGK